jgi:short-subunit dehydrogenase
MDPKLMVKQYALVTGASSGIGECFARALARRRQNVVAVARSKEKLENLAQELKDRQGIEAVPLVFDLSEAGASRRLVQALRERQLDISLLVNNAGFGAQGEFWQLPLDRLVAMLHLNIQASLELSALLIPPMIERRAGGVINVSSTASFQPLPYTAVYAATKAFVTSFSLGLAEELRPYHVRVVTLCPGTTRTRFFEAGGYSSLRFRVRFQAPEKVAEAGLKALDRGGGLTLPGWIDRCIVFAERFVPRSWIVRGAAGMFKP